MQRTRGMKRSTRHHQVETFLIYSLAAITCSLFCSCPFWLPSLCSSIEFFLFVSLPEVSLVVLSPKILFIIGNIIVVILIGESKFFASDSSPGSIVYYNEYIRSRDHQNSCAAEEIKERRLEKRFEENAKKTCIGGENIVKKRWVKNQATEIENRREEEYFPLTGDELSRRADDFIARVNRRRRLEADLYSERGKTDLISYQVK